MNYLLLVLVGLARFVPHAMNVTPIGATALFAGATCPPRIAWLVPLIPLFLGDALIGFYDPIPAIRSFCSALRHWHQG